MKEKRCAIYTRKSHEEGLEQEYNSLDAQRDACESYIKSQSNEGWSLVKKQYDDGGFSGGTLKRPALQKLLEDIRNDKVDVIVVYKIDRLTRSLMDFSNIINVLDEAEASFVSVTQHFNTTSSMGRLTLNVLLSFAQFEREITGERIRDKISASKKKGMWMGGRTPLGYNIVDKKLEINPDEAEHVRTVFESYVELGSVTDLVDDLKKKSVTTKRWDSANGNKHGGKHFQRGALYNFLQNHLYRGEIKYQGKVYEGQHKAIISKPLWDSVQEKMENNRRRQTEAKSKKAPYLLEGLIHDSEGHIMSPTYSVKKGNHRYPYYVSASLNGKRAVTAGEVARVPAQAIDDLIRDRIATIMNLNNSTKVDYKLAQKILHKVTIYKENVEVEINHALPNVDANRLRGNEDTVTNAGNHTQIRIPAVIRRRSRELALIRHNGKSPSSSENPDPYMLKGISLAFKWRESLEKGQFKTISQIAKSEGLSERYIWKILPLAYLAPNIIETILVGKQPASLELKTLHDEALPLSWNEQNRILGFTA